MHVSDMFPACVNLVSMILILLEHKIMCVYEANKFLKNLTVGIHADLCRRLRQNREHIYDIMILFIVVEALRGIRVIAPRHIIMVILFVDDVGRTFTILLKNSKPAAMFWVGLIAKPTRDHRDRDSRVAQHCRSHELLSLLAQCAGGVKGTP